MTELKENKDAILYMWYKVSTALEKHLSRLTKLPKWASRKGYKDLDELKTAYRERVNYEFKTIRNMGFCSYFLIVADGINFCKKQGIPVGPGRGSAAGCLCSYLLRITKIDPIKYDLLFERFLNPDRISMPDIDVDYSQEYRHRVKEYFAQKYGEDKVASIGTFSRMKVRAAIKDIVRSLNLGGTTSESFKLADQIAKTLENEDEDVEFLDALENEQFRAYIDKYPILGERIQQYENILRQMSMHAAGVLISSNRFDESLPMMMDKKGMTVTAYDGQTVEDLGYLKLDTLGLKNLDIIASCKANIEHTRGGVPDKMSLSGIEVDPKESQADIWARIQQLPEGPIKRASRAYHLLREGKTLGIFQCEMVVTADLLKRTKCNSIEDIADVIALIRPGPRNAGSTDVYVARKRKEEEVSYLHELESLPKSIRTIIDDPDRQDEISEIIEELEDYLNKGGDIKEVDKKNRWAQDIQSESFSSLAPKVCMWLEKLENPEARYFDLECIAPICNNTQGLPLFQEQLMRIAVRCANFSKGDSDSLRKAVGKKKVDLIKKIGKQFIDGMEQGSSDLNQEGMSRRAAQYVWYKFILPYGSYGFNLSHSVSYSFVSYETAYLKANYPAEFYASLLSHETNQEKINLIIAEAKAAGIRFSPPNINESTEKFEIVDQNTIVYALTLMKGVGDKAVEKIKENRPFVNMIDFIGRSGCNAATTKTLIKGGAFDNAFENEKVGRKNYYDFFEDCRTKLKRQTDRLLKESLLKKHEIEQPKPLTGEAKEKAVAEGTYKTPAQWFKDLLETNDAFRRDWEEGQLEAIKNFEYDWTNPVTISKKGEAQAVKRKDGDDREEWTQEEIFTFEEEIYGTTISGHRLDPYMEYERMFENNMEGSGFNRHKLSDDLDNWDVDAEVFIYAQGCKGPAHESRLKRPYRKDPKKFTRRFEIEDRTGKIQVLTFDGNYKQILKKFGEPSPLSVLEKYTGYRPVMILKCKVNEWNHRKNLILLDVIEWINKDEIISKINESIEDELYNKEVSNE